MVAPPPYLWFPTSRQLVVSRKGSPDHLYVFHVGRQQLLGELLPLPDRHQLMIAALADDDKSFTIQLHRGRSGAVVHRHQFAKGPGLTPRFDRSAVTWNLSGWQEVEASVIGWNGKTLTYLDRKVVNSGSTTLAVLPEWEKRGVEIVLTPFNAEGHQGPSEAVWTTTLPVAVNTASWLQHFAPAGEEVPILDRLRTWPAPIVSALVSSLEHVRTHTKGGNRFPEAVCKALSRQRDFLSFLDVYEQQSDLVHLFADNVHLLKLVIRDGLPSGALPTSAAAIVAHAAGKGKVDPRLLQRLEKADGDEIGFWASVVYERRQSQALYWLRVERGCPVEVEEAEEIEPLLRRLDAEPLDDLLAELIPDSSSSLYKTVRQARDERQAALEELAPSAIRNAITSLHEARRQLNEHLQNLVQCRLPSPWSRLQEAARLLGDGRPVAEATALLRTLRRNETVPCPAVTPPCLLNVDAVWMYRLLEDERRKRESLLRTLGWCGSVLDGKLVPLTETTLAVEDSSGPLTARWQQWVAARGNLDVISLYKAIGFSGGDGVYRCLLQELGQAEALLAQAEGNGPITGILRAMRKEALHLTAWLQQQPLRQAAEERFTQLQSGLRCEEARAQAAGGLAQAWKIIAEPVFNWGQLPALIGDLVLLESQERDSDEAWAELCGRLETELRQQLYLSSWVSPLDHGLDAVVRPLQQHIPTVARSLEDQLGRLKLHLDSLNDRGRLLDPAWPAAEWDRLSAEDKIPPRFYTQLYAALLELVQQQHEKTYLESLVRQTLAKLKDTLQQQIRAVLEPPHAPGITVVMSPSAQAEIGQVHQALEALFESGDIGESTAYLNRLERVARALAERRDLLGLEQVPTGLRLLTWPEAVPWVRHRTDTSLVAYLQVLASAPCNPAALLRQAGELEALEAALEQVRQAGQGRPRRWWERLYRDMSEVLRGMIASFPHGSAPWQAPEMKTRLDVEMALDWLQRVNDAMARREPIPEALQHVLAEKHLLIGSRGSA